MFEKINGVEDLLKQDPANVYEQMDYKTKEYYRMKIKEIANATKMSEIYITKKILELARDKDEISKESHIGYYIIGDGINKLYDVLGYKTSRKMKAKDKVKVYILSVFSLSTLFTIIMSLTLQLHKTNLAIFITSLIIFFIPTTEFVIQFIQWILGKIVKPKMIPKLDMKNGIPKHYATMVVIPTILDSSKKTKELIEKLEVFYLANKSKNIYLHY